MKQRMALAMLPCLIALLTSASASAASHAEQEPIFLSVACYKALPGKQGEFSDFLTGDARKLAEASVGQGQLIAWSAGQTVIPLGEEADCNFTTARAYRGMPDTLQFFSDEAYTKTKIKREDVQATVSSTARMQNTRLWRAVGAIGEEPGEGDYYSVDLMRAPDLGEWAEVENRIWRPVHEERTKSGPIAGWAAYALVMPRGADLPFNAATVNVLKGLKSVGAPPGYNAVFEKVHPDVNRDWIFERTEGSRTIVQSVVVRVIARVAAE